MSRQHINYVDPANLNDPEMIAEMERCAREGTPRPESQAIRAHVPAVFKSFADSWKSVFREGVCAHDIKELCRVFVSRSVKCEYCGNQRSEKSRASGMSEGAYDDLLMFRRSERYDARQKAALEYAEAILWNNPEDEEAMWARLHTHFSEPELVELGYFIALTLGQQSWLRTLNIEHHQVKAGSAASLAPGMEDAASLKSAKSSEDYWARR